MERQASSLGFDAAEGAAGTGEALVAQLLQKKSSGTLPRLTAGKSVAMLPHYVGKEASVVLPPMSATAATTVR
jgi:hypothetical protein